MTRFRFSIRARLTLFIVAFVTIVVGVAISGVLTLRSADLKTKEIDQKWLAATATLAEIADRISEYRIAEGYRALAAGASARAEAEVLADGHRREIQTLQNGYATLLGDDAQSPELEAFRTAWIAYSTEHDAWVQSDVDGAPENTQRHNQLLQRLYKRADLAVDRLIATNTSAAHAQAKAVDLLTDRSATINIAVSALSILLAMWILIRIRTQITHPLEAITQALSKLAAGNRDIRVPELQRADEIGAMAKAFEIFRINALALEHAHEATRAAREQVHSLARHDALTGLPNRRVFCAELQAILTGARRGAVPHWVLLVGLDQFKRINDLQGQSFGDAVLCEIARRLEQIVGNDGTVARLGGDEFAIIAKGAANQQTDLDGARELARKVLSAIRKAVLVGERSVELGASIGIAPCHTDSTDAESLLHAADVAMYRAKRDCRGAFRFFEQSMDDDLRAQGSLEADLKCAITEGVIKPFYQPIVEIRNNRICGFEALARWQHPQRGFVPPDLFIPVVEQLGLMTDLTSLVLRQACQDARYWPEDIRLSVNISPSELKDPLLPSRLLAILEEQRFPAARLDVKSSRRPWSAI
jgi:diguanylate cyclase (GGDEF)-like protein